MTDVAIPEAQIEPYTPVNVTKLADWALEARAAASLAQSLCKTSFVPAHFRNKPEETTAAILTGHELGLSPMASVRSIFVISGTPGMYAKTMVAVVQSRGHDVWVESQSDDEVIVCGRRKGSEHIARTVWNPARVILAGLTTNPLYKKSPQQMMTARGQAEICRQIASDALLGIPYAVEEIEDFAGTPVRAETVQTNRITAAEILGTPAAIEAAETVTVEEEWPETAQPADPEVLL